MANDLPPIPQGIKIATIASGIAFSVPIIIFLLTHNMHPGPNPGGLGEGYDNMLDALKYSFVVVPAFVIFLITGTAWFIAAVTGKK